ncbi:MAG: dihydroorotase [Pseudomonadota bacterium]
MKIQIKNGRFIDPANNIDANRDLFIAAGKVVGIGAAPDGFHANRVIDATNKIACPGFIDLAARLREPGLEYKATLESEMSAAVAGGVTSLCCLPDTDPTLDEPGLVEMLKYRAKGLNKSHVYPVGALTVGLKGQKLTELAQLVNAGCVAFSHADYPLTDTQVLSRALAYASTFGFSVWLRPQDAFLAKDGVAHDGEVASRMGLPAIPTTAETIAIATILELVRANNARVHFCRVSSAPGVQMIRVAKAEGLPVTCDVDIHHLHLCDRDLGYFDSHCNLMPPLRGLRDRDALRNGLKDGAIDTLCSDHTPVDDDAKQVPFGEAEPGATGLELLLPLMLKWATEMQLPLLDALATITSKPAKVLGLPIGHLALGRAADVVVFDPAQAWTVNREVLRSQGKNTPFIGLEMIGRVTNTLVDGQVVYEG